MENEQKPLAEFTAVKTANGGWIISEWNGRRRSEGYVPSAEYSYSSTDDMLAALPALIGVGVAPVPSSGGGSAGVASVGRWGNNNAEA